MLSAPKCIKNAQISDWIHYCSADFHLDPTPLWTLDIANKRKHKFLRLSKEEQEKRQRREQTLWAKQITAHKSWYRLTKVNKVIGPKFGLQVKMDWLIQRLLDLEADSTELGV